MLDIDKVFDTLDVPTRCRSCPEVGKLAVEYGAIIYSAEILEDMVTGDDMSEINAAILAEEVSIPYEEALAFVKSNAEKTRMTTADILNENEEMLPTIATQLTELLNGCNEGTKLETQAESAVFICTTATQQ